MKGVISDRSQWFLIHINIKMLPPTDLFEISPTWPRKSSKPTKSGMKTEKIMWLRVLMRTWVLNTTICLANLPHQLDLSQRKQSVCWKTLAAVGMIILEGLSVEKAKIYWMFFPKGSLMLLLKMQLVLLALMLCLVHMETWHWRRDPSAWPTTSLSAWD